MLTQRSREGSRFPTSGSPARSRAGGSFRNPCAGRQASAVPIQQGVASTSSLLIPEWAPQFLTCISASTGHMVLLLLMLLSKFSFLALKVFIFIMDFRGRKTPFFVVVVPLIYVFIG